MKMASYNNKNVQIVQTNDLLSYYLTININNICRICLEKSSKLMPIFDPIKPPHFSVLIMACASVQVNAGDGLPPYICQKCISKLNIAFQFKTQCESSDAKLRQCFETYQLPPAAGLDEFVELKKEGIITYSTENNVALDPGVDEIHRVVQEGNIQNIQNTEIEVVAAVQQIDEGQHTNNVDISDTITLTHTTPEHFSAEYKIEQSKNNDMELKAEDFEYIQSQLGKIQKPKKVPKKMHQCDTCGKEFRTKPSLVHHIRIHTGERPYVCHLCEKRFINGGHLYTHMRIHTGEKNHICVACSKAFATAQQLTKHTIAIHTSERPYACTYCPKRFASSSNLNTHIKIHTGEKNYHCEHCGKTFSTKGQLYQHMLIHTGEKAFMCEFCYKRFSQKAHLVRHLKTHRTTGGGGSSNNNSDIAESNMTSMMSGTSLILASQGTSVT